MSLRSYHQKRNFKKTKEPYGKKLSEKNNLYIIQKHDATRLHYDLRLELDGVLKSWAVPKGPSLDPTVKRLAVHVEDHPIEYGSFEGIIPEDEYGGGTVMLWDKGQWISQDANQEEAYKKGNMTFLLKGKKLKGLWKLVRIKTDPKNWLLIKIKDDYSCPEKKYDITKELPLSVKSNETLDEIAAESENVWGKKGLEKRKSKTISAKKKVIKLTHGKKAPMPSIITPELATLVAKPPNGSNWLHEIKFDGYRLIAFIKGKSIKLMTRRHNDWTNKFPHLVKALSKLKLSNAILDGEIVALDKNQKADFQLLQNSIHEGEDSEFIYYLFDIIYFNQYDLTSLPLIERKKILKNLLPKDNVMLRFSDHVIGDGQEVFNKAKALSLEGIVSKEINSTYDQHRTRNWLKIKSIQRQEFVIGGFTKPSGKRSYFGSLLLGYYKNKKLHYCGHVGTGFTEESLKTVVTELKKHQTETMPFAERPEGSKHVTWVQPKLVAEVEFSEWTRDGILRTPSFKGLRSDKSPKNIKRELPMTITSTKKKVNSSSSKDFPLTNPDRILYPKEKITKLDLANYYESIREWILPYVINRPLALLRCPQGISHKCFFQKHLHDYNPEGIFNIPIKEKHKKENYIYIKNITGLISLVQMNVLELHPWGSRIDDIEKPDMIIFDLDPAPNLEWKKVIQAAFLVKEQLENINLVSFVKTTGGKGLHVVLPIRRFYEWDTIKAFSKTLVEFIVEQRPHEFVSNMSKEKRSGKIFLDYLRNQRGATAVAAYSTRAKDNATVSTPLSWDELTVRIKSDNFNIHNIPERLASLKKDPWEGFFKLHQSLKDLKPKG